MPRHRNLNLKKFIDSIPASLLEEYFTHKLGDDQPLSLQAFDYETVAEFIDTNQDEALIGSILEDFTHINDLGEKVMNILNQAVDRYGIMTSGEEQRQELAMDLFLHHKEAYEYAYDRFCLFNATSKMSQHNIATEGFELTPAKVESFKSRVSDFYSKLAKGQECLVRHYDEKDQTVVVIIHGSYKRSVVVWDGQEIKTIFFRPANEDILLYDRSTATLSVKARVAKDRDHYIKAFTSAILEDESQASRQDRDATYTLKPLQDGTFSFEGNEEIISITLREVKLKYGGITSPEITVKSDDVLETLKGKDIGISLNAGEIITAKFRFRLDVDGKQRNVTFEITPPNVTDLTRKKYADIISAYLKENGIKLV